MKKAALFTLLIGILLAAAYAYQNRQGMELFSRQDSTSTTASTPVKPLSTSASTPVPAEPNSVPQTTRTPASPAPPPSAKPTAIAVLKKESSTPTLSPTDSNLRESEFALEKLKRMQSEALLNRFRQHQAQQAAAASATAPSPGSSTATTPAVPTPILSPDTGPIPAPPPGTKVPSS